MSNAELINAYIKFAEAEEDSSEYDNYFWASDKLSVLCMSQPKEAWANILGVLSRDPGPKVIEILAAGPLEDLLVNHGRSVINEIENEARTNNKITFLLGGVWRNEMDEDVWKRVEAARSKKW